MNNGLTTHYERMIKLEKDCIKNLGDTKFKLKANEGLIKSREGIIRNLELKIENLKGKTK